MRFWSVVISAVVFAIIMNVTGSLLGIDIYEWRILILMMVTLIANAICLRLETGLRASWR